MSWSTLASGDAVEVLSDDGDDCAWRPARLIHVFLNRRLYFLAFDNGAVRATVPADRVRPRPDPSSSSDFKLHQLVDALVNGVWMPGVVSKVHVAERERKYGVCFPHVREEMEFELEEIRARLDWVDGKWVSAEEKDKSIKSQNLGRPKSSDQIKVLHASNTAHKSKVLGSITPSSGCGDEALCQFPIPTPNSENENIDTLTFQSQLECSRPCKKAKKGEMIEDNTRLMGLRDTETSAMKTGFDVCTPIIEEAKFHIKALVENCSGSPFEKMNALSAGSIAKLASKILLEDPLMPEKLSQEDKPVSNKREELFKERPANSLFLRTANSERQRDKGVRQHTSREKRRKSSRPRKLRILEPSLEGDSMGNQPDNIVVGEPQIEELPTTKRGTFSDNSLEDQVLFNTMVGSSDAGAVETSASGVQLSEAGSEARNEVILSTVGKQLAKRDVIEKAGDAVKPRLDKSPQEQSPLPFEKCSFMWDYIESMEVFALMPQHPHFRPLEQYHKYFREGMAIGMMVTFSNLVNSIAKLQIVDSRHKFDNILKTLVNLEGHGFDVQHLQARLGELLRMKEKQERLVDDRSALEELIIKRKREKDGLNSELESIERVARELEQTLSHLHEEKSHILAQKRENDSKLDKLEMDSRRVEHALLSAEQDFEATLSAKWTLTGDSHIIEM